MVGAGSTRYGMALYYEFTAEVIFCTELPQMVPINSVMNGRLVHMAGSSLRSFRQNWVAVCGTVIFLSVVATGKAHLLKKISATYIQTGSINLMQLAIHIDRDWGEKERRRGSIKEGRFFGKKKRNGI